MYEHSKFFCLVIVKSENDYCWFSVESNYVSAFIFKFFMKARKVEKVLGKGLFNLFGYIPTVMIAKLVTKFDYDEIEYSKYVLKRNEQIKELKI